MDVDLTDIHVGTESGERMRVPNYRSGPRVSYDGTLGVRFFYRGEIVHRDPEDYLPLEPDDLGPMEPRDEPSPTVPVEEENRAESEQDAVFVGSVVLNPEWSETLLVWQPASGNQFSILALPNDLQTLPVDHLRFINATPARAGFKVRDGTSRVLNPGEHYILNCDNAEVIRFQAAMEVDGGIGERINNAAEMRPHVRRTVFLTFSNSAATGRDPLGPPSFGFFIMTHD